MATQKHKKLQFFRIFNIFVWKLLPYVRIARVDHWFKNTFMLLGILLAFFIFPVDFSYWFILKILGVFFIVCLVTSSNYVLNEIMDAPMDIFHPEKHKRPIPSNKVKIPPAYVQWLFLGISGISLAFSVNKGFGYSALLLWIMGILYNVPPFRLKDFPYLDVLTESVNNPLRLLLGWFVIIPNIFPPASLLIAYWMLGAYFMGLKRFAEFRYINDHETAAKYRKSFIHYNQDRLLISSVFYILNASLFTGVFIVRYQLELVFLIPFVAAFLAYYLKLSMEKDSPVQAPEKLYRNRGFMILASFNLVVFIILMLIKIPSMYDFLNVRETRPAFWTIQADK